MSTKYIMRDFTNDLQINTKFGVFPIPKEMIRYSRIQRDYESWVFSGHKIEASFSIEVSEKEATRIMKLMDSHLSVCDNYIKQHFLPLFKEIIINLCCLFSI